MSKSEELLKRLFKVLLLGSGDTLWWANIKEKAGIDPFEPDCPDHLLALMDYYLKCQQRVFERIQIYCEREIRKSAPVL